MFDIIGELIKNTEGGMGGTEAASAANAASFAPSGNEVLDLIGKLGVIRDANRSAPQANNAASDAMKAQLLSLIGEGRTILTGTSNQFSKENAMQDSQAAIANIFRQYRNTDLPNIYQAQGNSGGYNATTGQLLANDAFGAAAAKGAELELKTINDYRRLQQGDFTALAGLFPAQALTPAAAPAAKKKSGVGTLVGTAIGSLFGAPQAGAAIGSML